MKYRYLIAMVALALATTLTACGGHPMFHLSHY